MFPIPPISVFFIPSIDRHLVRALGVYRLNGKNVK